ncbi:MAG: hypothetical protein H0X26_01205 [Alphaproteobacteria bacterium]|nr:hypothetical protein [Alphaproteobacteria bacterium]
MTNMKLAYIEHIIQLLICKIETAKAQTDNTWRDLESIRSNLSVLSKVCDEWIVGEGRQHDGD